MMSGTFTVDRNAVARVAGVASAAQGRMTRVLATIMSSLMVLLLGVALLPPSASAQESAAAPSATRLSGFDRSPASVRVGGQLADTVSVSPKAARTVYVQYRRAGTTRFTTAYKAKASAQGWFTAFLMPRSAGTWQFRLVVVATTRAKAVVSPLRTVKASGRAVPTKIIGFSTTRSTITAGNTVRDAISVSPRASRLIEVQARRAGTSTWVKTSTSGRSTMAGNFTAVYRPSAGVWQYRLVARASTRARTAVSATRTITVAPPADTTAPGPVTGLTATVDSVDGTKIALAWVNPTGDFTGVVIRRAIGNVAPVSISDGTLVADTLKAMTSFNDTVAAGKYSYALFAHDAPGNNAAGVSTTKDTTADNTSPGPVTGLTATALGATSIALSWTNPTDADFTGVTIRRAEGASAPALPTDGIRVPTPMATTATDTGLTAGTEYSYAVIAHDGVPNYATATTKTAKTIKPVGAGAISGTVIDATGTQGLANVQIQVNQLSGGTWENATTAANGSYTVTGLPAGDYQVCFTAAGATGGSSNGYLDQCYYNQPRWSGTPTPVTVDLSATTRGIDAALDEAGSISGTVTDAADTHGLAGVQVYTYSALAESYSNNTTSAADGSYTLTGLPAASDYAVCFIGRGATGGSSNGYFDQCYDDQVMSGMPTPVTVDLGANTPGIDAALDEGGAISGRVTDEGGQPLANVGVSVEVPFNVSVGWGVTAADGTYTVTGIPAGDYQVCFYAGLPPGGSTNGYVDECFDNTTPPVAPTLLTVMAGVTRTGTDASLVEAGSVAGTVTDAVTGLPLADVWVTVSYGHPGPESPGANTAADGTYKMTGLPAGDYQVCFRGWGASVGYVYECYDSQPTPGTPTPVTVVQGVARTGVDATLD